MVMRMDGNGHVNGLKRSSIYRRQELLIWSINTTEDNRSHLPSFSFEKYLTFLRLTAIDNAVVKRLINSKLTTFHPPFPTAKLINTSISVNYNAVD